MELASGIAGLLGLAGLAVKSASTLYTFCHKVPRVAGEVGAIKDEIQRLNQSLELARKVVVDRKIQKASPQTHGLIGKLEEEVARCTADLKTWITSMDSMQLEDKKWAKNSFKKLKLAADSRMFAEIRSKISSHTDQMALLLDLLVMDLGMSTSLEIQTIDSKVDILAANQTSSQQAIFNHLEGIQEDMQTATTFQSTGLTEIIETRKSTSKIHDIVHDIRSYQKSAQQATQLQVEKLDATITAIQRSLLSATRPARSHPRNRPIRKRVRHDRPITESEEYQDNSMTGIFSEIVQRTIEPSIIPVQINRLVDIAITVRYRCGRASFEAVAVPDPDFEAADIETKLRMIKYLQNLRLLLWLLYRQEYSRDRIFALPYHPHSELIPEAQLVSSWTQYCVLQYHRPKLNVFTVTRNDNTDLNYLAAYIKHAISVKADLEDYKSFLKYVGLLLQHLLHQFNYLATEKLVRICNQAVKVWEKFRDVPPFPFWESHVMATYRHQTLGSWRYCTHFYGKSGAVVMLIEHQMS